MRTYAEYLKLVEESLCPQLRSLGYIPEKLLSSMEYSLSAGGKRLRPVLLLAACDMAGGKVEDALPFACALEMIHAYANSHQDTQVIRLWNQPEFFETPEDVGNYKKVREDIFAKDMVHPNQAGYDILKEIFTKALDELL